MLGIDFRQKKRRPRRTALYDQVGINRRKTLLSNFFRLFAPAKLFGRGYALPFFFGLFFGRNQRRCLPCLWPWEIKSMQFHVHLVKTPGVSPRGIFLPSGFFRRHDDGKQLDSYPFQRVHRRYTPFYRLFYRQGTFARRFHHPTSRPHKNVLNFQ